MHLSFPPTPVAVDVGDLDPQGQNRTAHVTGVSISTVAAAILKQDFAGYCSMQVGLTVL